MQTLKDIDFVFREIVKNHKVLQSYYTISTKELDIDKLGVDKYPLLYANCTNARIDSGALEFTYEVIVGDLMVEELDDNLVDVYNETLHLVQDVVAQFELSVSGNQKAHGNTEWAFDLPVSCTPYTSRFSNLLTGWSTSFTIRVPQAVDLCDALY